MPIKWHDGTSWKKGAVKVDLGTGWSEYPVKIYNSSTSSWETVVSTATLTISATLNTGSASITVYEDTTGDGIADNSVSHTIADGVNDYDTGSLDMSGGNEVWYELETDNGTIAETVEIDYIEITY